MHGQNFEKSQEKILRKIVKILKIWLFKFPFLNTKWKFCSESFENFPMQTFREQTNPAQPGGMIDC